MKIITISREFGSGGRELGKRLADTLEMAYYDREIITAIAERSHLNEQYITSTLEKGSVRSYPVTFGRTFSYPAIIHSNVTKILVIQQQIIKELADQGKDFVIVGRSADIILRNDHPLNLFVYAEMDSKRKRCEERISSEKPLTKRELEKKIRQVDSNRAKHRELLTNGKWGQKENYHLCINTTDLIIKELTPLISEYIQYWFRRSKK